MQVLEHCECSLTHSVLLETISLLTDEAFEPIKQSSTSYSNFKALDHTVLSDKLPFQIQQHCQVIVKLKFPWERNLTENRGMVESTADLKLGELHGINQVQLN